MSAPLPRPPPGVTSRTTLDGTTLTLHRFRHTPRRAPVSLRSSTPGYVQAAQLVLCLLALVALAGIVQAVGVPHLLQLIGALAAGAAAVGGWVYLSWADPDGSVEVPTRRVRIGAHRVMIDAEAFPLHAISAVRVVEGEGLYLDGAAEVPVLTQQPTERLWDVAARIRAAAASRGASEPETASDRAARAAVQQLLRPRS